MGFIYLLTPVVVWVTVGSAIVYRSEVVDFSFVFDGVALFANLFGYSFFSAWQPFWSQLF